MRISEISFFNYRQLKKLHLFFSHGENDLHLFVAQNGTAKTNILNGINWCFYGDEAHLNEASLALPLVNLDSLVHHNEGETLKVEVTITLSGSEGLYVTFRRTWRYIIRTVHNNRKDPKRLDSNFTATIQMQGKTSDIKKQDEAEILVQRFIPRNIREFYFFNGERLDTYFKQATGNKIQETINKISGIDLLRSVLRKLTSYKSELNRELSSGNPDIQSYTDQLEALNCQLDEDISEKKNCNSQIEIAESRIDEINNELRDIPDIEENELKIAETSKAIDEYEKNLGLKQKDKTNYIFKRGVLLYIEEILSTVKNLIDDKKKRNELPPPIDKDVLTISIKKDICQLTRVDLPDDCSFRMQDLLDRIELSNKVSVDLVSINPYLSNISEELHDFKDLLIKHNKGINELIIALSKAEQLKRELEEIGSNYNVDNIKNLYEERNQLQSTCGQNFRKLGVLEDNIENLKLEKIDLEGKLEKAIKRDVKNKTQKQQLALLSNTKKHLDELIEEFTGNIQSKVSSKINDYFFDLIWKRDTYKEIELTEEFSVNLIHKLGYTALGSTSGAEMQLLALSFTLALHKISGFDGPLFIDTPVAKVSDINRVNMGNTMLEVSRSKQVVLLFTPDEFTDNIQEVLLPETDSKFLLKLSADESTVICNPYN